MANIIPFKGIRPTKEKVHLVASLPISEYTTNELKKELSHNPYSFLQIINPEFNDIHKTKPNSVERLQKIKKKYLTFIEEKILVQDQQPSYYIYQKTNKQNTYTGIIACCSIDDYLNGVIKIHEQTITDREEKLKDYLEICDFNVEPVLFTYPNDATIDKITLKTIQLEPEYDFITTDNVRHQLWVVNDTEQVKKIQHSFLKIPTIYIADGHHRSASSALFGKNKRIHNPDYTGNEAFNFYMGIFFPETQLKIFDFNRAVKDLSGLTVDEIIQLISKKFSVTKKNEQLYKPSKKHNFSMYLAGQWYSLDAKKSIIHDEDPTGGLDSSILLEHILTPIFNIKDLKTNKRIKFIPGTKGMEELKKQVESGKFDIAFGLFPVELAQMKLIADSHMVMPPKTTWVEPKMRSALVIYSLTN